MGTNQYEKQLPYLEVSPHYFLLSQFGTVDMFHDAASISSDNMHWTICRCLLSENLYSVLHTTEQLDPTPLSRQSLSTV